MARLLHDDGDLCRDLRGGHRRCDSDMSGGMSGNVSGTTDCSGSSGSSDSSGSSGSSGSTGCRHDRRRRHERLIRIGNVSIDCTPVRFATPCQAKNIVSCAVRQTVTVPVTQTTLVQTPGPDGCITCTPVTRTVQMPVSTTVNVPPVLVPVPRIVCPPNVLPCGCGCSNP